MFAAFTHKIFFNAQREISLSPRDHVISSIYNAIKNIILLPEKFLEFDWLRAEVFQLNLKQLHVHVKITVTTETEITKQSRHASYKKMAERFPDFEIQESQELNENSENQNTKKSTSTWCNVWTSWAENKNFETNF